MPDPRTLLERLSDPQTERTIRVDTPALTESVMRNLHRILNSRRGGARTVPDYGLPDLADVVHSFPDVIVELSRIIKECIERYEPRLRNVRVTFVPDEADLLILRFHIAAELAAASGERQRISFESTISSSGKATIRR
jgi:type VI secretion system protein